ncbi:MAG: histidine kinase [Pseudomonadota bacterium]
MASEGARPGFPFGRLARDGAVVAVVCVACALIISILGNRSNNFHYNLVFSLVIGGIAFLLIDVTRLLLWSDPSRPNKLAFFAIALLAMPVAQFGGTMLASKLLGLEVPTFARLVAGGSNGMLLFTLIVSSAAMIFLQGRDRLRRAETAAAEEKARAEAIARQALQAQLQLLQAQIEPHMLFNTLANLQGMIALDPARAQAMLDQLIQYLRATLTSSRAVSTTLAQEFTLMDAYLGLMSVRMGTRLAYTLELPAALRGAQLPPMLLQPLVENAIIHGLEPKVDGGHITVSAVQAGAMLVLSVIDNGLGLAAPSAKNGTHLGVSNTRERLQALFGTAASLALEPNLPQGATARLTLPMRLP